MDKIFPTLNAKVVGLNPQFQKLADFSISLEFLKKAIPHKIIPSPQIATPAWLNYYNYTLFAQLCFDFCEEIAINESNKVLAKNKERYLATQNSLLDCIALMEQNKEVMDADMSYLFGRDSEFDRYYPDNWYKLIYDYLVIVKDVFIDKLSGREREYTHREYCLAHEYKMSAYPENVKELTAKEMKEISSKRYEAHQSLQKSHKKFRAVQKEELENTIKLLAAYPEAQTLASEYLKVTFKY